MDWVRQLNSCAEVRYTPRKISAESDIMEIVTDGRQTITRKQREEREREKNNMNVNTVQVIIYLLKTQSAHWQVN